jgi:hypothetical protein
MKKRLLSALFAYFAIAVMAFFTLDGGLLRNVVWVVMAGLAVKTYVAYRAGWTASSDEDAPAVEAPPRLENSGAVEASPKR